MERDDHMSEKRYFNRVVSYLMTALMLVSAVFFGLPDTAGATETVTLPTSITLGGHNVNLSGDSGSGADSGTWSYDPALNTLTLADYDDASAADPSIIADGDLTIKLSGDNSVGFIAITNGDLTIIADADGAGTLLAKSGSHAAISVEGSMIVSGGTVEGRGIYAGIEAEEDITISGSAHVIGIASGKLLSSDLVGFGIVSWQGIISINLSAGGWVYAAGVIGTDSGLVDGGGICAGDISMGIGDIQLGAKTLYVKPAAEGAVLTGTTGAERWNKAIGTQADGAAAEVELRGYINVTGITLNQTSLSLNTGAEQTLVATAAPNNADNKLVNWSSNNQSVATVDGNGKVTAAGPGTATVTATAADGSNQSASCTVTVTQPVTGITLNQSSLALTVGDVQTLAATVNPANASNPAASWTSDNTSIATVDSNGAVTAVGAGVANITVTTADGGLTDSCVVSVQAATIPATGVTLDKTTSTLTVGSNLQLTGTVAPGNATNKAVSWTSSNTAVATVDSNGKVTAVAAGAAAITVTTADGNKTAVCAVVVQAATIPVTDVSLSRSAASLNVGGTLQLIATVLPSNATNKGVNWISSNTAVATVDSNGNVTAVTPGTAAITVTTQDGSKTAVCTVTVSQTLTLTGWPTNNVLKDGQSFTLTANISNGTWNYDAAYWDKKDNDNGSVTFTAKKLGTTTISYTVNGQTESRSITITSSATAQTGDDFLPIIGIGGVLLGLAGIVIVFIMRKKNKEKES